MQLDDLVFQQARQGNMESPHFLFYHGDDAEFLTEIKTIAARWFLNVATVEHPGFSLIGPGNFLERCSVSEANLICAFTGWARSSALPPVKFKVPDSFHPHLLEVARNIQTGWPILSSEITGNFSGIIFSRPDRGLLVFSDPVSIYPLYYATLPHGFVGGTHLLFLARLLRREADLVGVVERLSPPGFVNYGDRTIFKGIKRVPTGELFHLDYGRRVKAHLHDHTLYANPPASTDIHELAESVWGGCRDDVQCCVGEGTRVNLGLSAGWDSRLVAAALRDRETYCHTYAVDADEYEVIIAAEVSMRMGAKFCFTDFSPEFVPSRERFIQNLLCTEATHITEWLAILDKFPSFTFEPFLLGDMYEAIAGRYISQLSSRSNRKRLYVDRIFGRFTLPSRQKGDFGAWRELKIQAALDGAAFAMSGLTSGLIDQQMRSQIIDEILSDLEQVFLRISNHELSSPVLFDEFFAWSLWCGFGTGKQFLTLNERFFGLNPTMSFRALRFISSIHPFKRASGELMHQIQQLPDLDFFSSIPNANAPYIPSRSPLWLTDLVWAARFVADHWIIRRALRGKNKGARSRFLKTHSLVRLYNLPGGESRVFSWFIDNDILPGQHLHKFASRAQMETWPLYPYDITAPAAVSMALASARWSNN